MHYVKDHLEVRRTEQSNKQLAKFALIVFIIYLIVMYILVCHYILAAYG